MVDFHSMTNGTDGTLFTFLSIGNCGGATDSVVRPPVSRISWNCTVGTSPYGDAALFPPFIFQFLSSFHLCCHPTRSTPHRVLTLASDPQPEPAPSGAHFNQFARIDEGLWAWHFVLRDARGEGIACVSRAFRGFGREIFTDTGQYAVSFRASDEQVFSLGVNGEEIRHRPNVVKDLTLDERALVLAMAVNIDYDYFSRHSQGGHGFGFPLWWSSGE